MSSIDKAVSIALKQDPRHLLDTTLQDLPTEVSVSRIIDPEIAVQALVLRGEINERLLSDRSVVSMASRDRIDQNYKLAIHIIEGVRLNLQKDLARVGFGAHSMDPYHRLMASLYKRYSESKNPEDARRAFRVAMRGKSQAIKSMLQERGIIKRYESPQDLVGLANALKEYKSRHSALLQYYIGSEGVFLLVLRETGDIAFVRLEVGAEEITDLIDPMNEPLRRLHSREDQKPFLSAVANPTTPVEEIHRLGVRLYELLLPPGHARDLAEDADEWFIVPAGVLFHLPWAALSDGHRFLIDSGRIISLLPAAYFLSPPEPNDRLSVNRLVALYDPTEAGGLAPIFELQRKVLRRTTREYDEHPSIQDARALTVAEVKEQMTRTDVDVLYFFMHGHHDAKRPLDSYLYLGSEKLTAETLLRWAMESQVRLSAKLVILGACESVVSRIEGGDEALGLVRAFLAIGAREILGTLWQVPGDVTGSILLLVLRFLRESPTLRVSEALARAQRQIRRQIREDYPHLTDHPANWAGVIVIGGPGLRKLGEPKADTGKNAGKPVH